MRKKDEVIIWPAYFDATRTRKEGRKVSRNMAVPSPKILEIKEAVEKLGIDYELVLDVGYPKTPWLKTGMFLVKKKEHKNETIGKIAKQLVRIHSQTQKR